MKSIAWVSALLFALPVASALAKLPAPTEEEKAKVEATKQKAAQDAEVEKRNLEKAQDRVVQKYKDSRKPGSQQADAGKATATDSRTEVPAAAVNSRPLEKAHAYNEGVTPQSARGASDGSKTEAAGVEQGKSR